MGWDLGLLLTTSVCLAIAIEALTRAGWRSQIAVSLLALAASFWSAGELLAHHAGSAGELLVARRILFAGLCALGPLLLWSASQLHTPTIRKVGRRAALVAGCIEIGVYASLYGPAPHLFIAGDPANPSRGVLFAVHAATQWSTLAFGLGLFALAVSRVAPRRRSTSWIVFGGIAAALVTNWLHVAFHVAPRDPTPLVVALTALTIRWGVLDLVGAPFLASLARSELMDQLDAAIVVADLRGRVLEMNETGRRLFETGRGELDVDLPTLVAKHEIDPDFDVRRFPLVRGHLIVGQGVVVTDRRRAREVERRAEIATRVEALGLLARGLAHEINNPLTSLRLATDLLGDEVEIVRALEPETARRMTALLDSMTTEGDRVAEVVRRMGKLAIREQEQPSPGRTNVQRALERAADLMRFGKDEGRIRTDVPEQALHAHAREEDLLQILLHLLSNALESDDRGQPVDASVGADGAWVVVEVADRGVGFGGVDPARLFDPYYVRKRPQDRIGLGLSLCWALARQNGGRLEAAEREGGGATLRLSLPRA